MNNLIIFTGGPGSGKTTIIDCLIGLSYQGANEIGGKVIQQQVDVGGNALPWDDKAAFRDEMVREEIKNYNCHKGSKKLVFFDRSIIDSYGYSTLESIPVSDELLEHCQLLEYHKKVFIFPPWESIYKNDDERKQDFDKAVATYQEMVSAYKKFGYSLIEVPKVSVRERVAFISEQIKKG